MKLFKLIVCINNILTCHIWNMCTASIHSHRSWMAGNTEQWAGQRAGLQHEIIQYGREVFPAVPSPAAPAMPSR